MILNPPKSTLPSTLVPTTTLSRSEPEPRTTLLPRGPLLMRLRPVVATGPAGATRQQGDTDNAGSGPRGPLLPARPRDRLSIPAVPGAVTGGNAAAGLAAAGPGHRGHHGARAVLGAAQRPGGAAPRHRPRAGNVHDPLFAAGPCPQPG